MISIIDAMLTSVQVGYWEAENQARGGLSKSYSSSHVQR